MDQNEINDRVARGATLLDEKRPNWLNDADLGRLSMIHGLLCILGQLYGSYSLGVAALWPDQVYSPHLSPGAASHGFQFPLDSYGRHDGPWALLDAAWTARITALRNEQVQTLLQFGWLLSRDSLAVISPATGRGIGLGSMREQLEELITAAA